MGHQVEGRPQEKYQDSLQNDRYRLKAQSLSERGLDPSGRANPAQTHTHCYRPARG